jgi:hypothetical protein
MKHAYCALTYGADGTRRAHCPNGEVYVDEVDVLDLPRADQVRLVQLTVSINTLPSSSDERARLRATRDSYRAEAIARLRVSLASGKKTTARLASKEGEAMCKCGSCSKHDADDDAEAAARKAMERRSATAWRPAEDRAEAGAQFDRASSYDAETRRQATSLAPARNEQPSDEETARAQMLAESAAAWKKGS